MKVRRFQTTLPKQNPFRPWRDCLEMARTECIGRARAELGPGAVFLNEETRTEERMLGLVRREIMEMLFADELDGTALEGHGKPLPAPPTKNGRHTPAKSNGAEEMATLERLEGEVRDLTDTVRTLARGVTTGGFTPFVMDDAPAPARERKPHAGLRALLAEAEVPEPIAYSLLARISPEMPEPLARNVLRGLVRDTFSTTTFGEPKNGEPKVLALVGPTGVGKTTTIAKIAAAYALSGKRRVGLVAMDTYRIAAVEQLRTYGEIMDVPVRVAHGRKDIEQALQSLSGCELIFIDTAGRSQKNREQVQEMERVFQGVACEPHLVVSATTKPRDLQEIAREFSATRFRSLVVTKLDETNTLGPLLGLVAQTGLPVSYVATGQRVPEDIEPADADRLAARVLDV